MATNGSKTFVRVTNQMIYEELQKLHACAEEQKTQLRINTWVSNSALGVAVCAIGWISHLARIV